MAGQKREDSYRRLAGPAYGEIVEKKSRFIAAAAPVSSEEEALAFLESVRRKYYDARHHCYAYLIRENGMLERFSDDGEPGGTAGRPMLEVLRGAGLSDTAAVVTRYFGGVLLGTGGLVRAYTQALQAALENAETVTVRYGARYLVTADYTLAGKLQYLFAGHGAVIEDTVYTDKVEFYLFVPFDMEERLKKEIVEQAAAKVKTKRLEYAWRPEKEGGGR